MNGGSFYKAFISYSHHEDGERAPRLQHALHRIGKPWFRRRAMHVFRDETNVPASAELWPEIVVAMEQSEYFILMASPGSASSVWVGREIDWWIENKSPSSILIVVTRGEIQWDDQIHDFDWTRTSAIHPSLKGRISSEPLYIDLRWAERQEDLQLRNAKFRVAAIRLAARLHGKSPDEMGGEDVRIYRLNLLWAWAAISLILIAAAGAVWQAVVATDQRREAEHERDIAMSRQLAAQAATVPGEGLGYDLGALLAVASYQITHTVEAKASLLAALQREPRLDKFLRGHSRWVTSVAFSPDASTIASGSRDGTVIIWDVTSGRQRSRLAAHDPKNTLSYGVLSVAYDPTGRLLATGGDAGSVKLWDVSSGRKLWESTSHDLPVTSVVFAPDGSILASGGYDGRIVLSDAQNVGRVRVLQIPHDSVMALAISPNERRVAAATDAGVYQWELDTGRFLGTLPGRRLTTVSFSPDGRILATGDADATVALWSVAENKLLASLRQHQGAVSCVFFDPEGTRLASASDDGSVVIWHIGRSEPVSILRGHRREVTSVAFSADGHHLVSGAYDKTVILWDLNKTSLRADLKGHTERSEDVAFAKDGKTLVSAGADAKVILWDIEKLQPIVQLGPRHRIRTRPIFPEPGIEVVEGVFSLDPVTTVAIGGDGKRIAASQGNNVTLWDVSAARVERKLQGGEGPIFSIAFSPTSSLIATATDRLEVVVWKADTGQAEQVLDAQKGSTFFSYEPRGNISFSPDGRLLAYWDSDDAVILWDVERRLIVAELKGHTRDIKSVAFSPNGKILASGGDDQRVVLWDVTNSRRIGELRERNKVTGVAFSADGKILASATHGEYRSEYAKDMGRVTLWDVDSLRQLGIVLEKGHWASFRLAFSPVDVDPQLAVAGSYDGTVKLWDIDPQNWMRQICQMVTRNLTRIEWKTYIGESPPFRPLCEEWGTNDGDDEEDARPGRR